MAQASASQNAPLTVPPPGVLPPFTPQPGSFSTAPTMTSNGAQPLQPPAPAAPVPAPSPSYGTDADALPGSAIGDTVTMSSRIANDLMGDYGLTSYQAAGIVGNLAHESAGFSTIDENDADPNDQFGGRGWAQWTNSGGAMRRDDFEAYCVTTGLDPSSYAANYGYLTQDPEFQGALTAVQAATTVEDATRAWETSFERAPNPAMSSRIDYASTTLAAVDPTAAGTQVADARVPTARPEDAPTFSMTALPVQTATAGLQLDDGNSVIAASPGTVTSVAPGTVTSIGQGIVEVDNGQGFTTRYSGLASVGVKKGDQVTAGQPLGAVAENSQEPVHFNLMFGGTPVDPTPYLNVNTTAPAPMSPDSTPILQPGSLAPSPTSPVQAPSPSAPSVPAPSSAMPSVPAPSTLAQQAPAGAPSSPVAPPTPTTMAGNDFGLSPIPSSGAGVGNIATDYPDAGVSSPPSPPVNATPSSPAAPAVPAPSSMPSPSGAAPPTMPVATSPQPIGLTGAPQPAQSVPAPQSLSSVPPPQATVGYSPPSAPIPAGSTISPVAPPGAVKVASIPAPSTSGAPSSSSSVMPASPSPDQLMPGAQSTYDTTYNTPEAAPTPSVPDDAVKVATLPGPSPGVVSPPPSPSLSASSSPASLTPTSAEAGAFNSLTTSPKTGPSTLNTTPLAAQPTSAIYGGPDAYTTALAGTLPSPSTPVPAPSTAKPAPQPSVPAPKPTSVAPKPTPTAPVLTQVPAPTQIDPKTGKPYVGMGIGAGVGLLAGGLPGAALGSIFGGLAQKGIQKITSPAALATAPSYTASSSGSGGTTTGPMVGVMKISTGLYTTTYGNTIDLNKMTDPAQVALQPGGKEVLAAAGQESLQDSGLYSSGNNTGSTSPEADAAAAAGQGGLF